MANAEQLKALVKSHIDRSDRHFYSVAMQVAAREAKRGHSKLTQEQGHHSRIREYGLFVRRKLLLVGLP